jgi:hypothetical protein
MVVSSAATKPTRAPASMAMLHTVMRPSIDRPRIALPAEFDGVAVAAGGADAADDGQHHILRRDARRAPIDADQHGLRLLLHQALRGHHVLDFRGTDAVRQAGEGAVRRGVRVAADDGHARQRGAVLRADHVHDALARSLNGK